MNKILQYKKYKVSFERDGSDGFPLSFCLRKGLVACLFAGFVTVFPAMSSAEEPDLSLKKTGDTFSQAEYLFHSGGLLEAKRLYQEFLGLDSSGPRVERALLRLGEIDQANKFDATALEFFKILLDKFPSTPLMDDAKFYMAISYFRIDKIEKAEALFREILNNSLDKNRRIEALYYLGRIDGLHFGYEDAITKLKQTYLQSNKKEVREQASLQMDQMIGKKLSKIQLITLYHKFKTGIPVDRILLRLIELYRVEGDISGYKRTLEDFIRLFPDHPNRSKLEGFLTRVQEGGSGLPRLGVILPLTGDKAMTGQQVLQGIQLAINQSDLGLKEKLELVVRNSASTASVSDLAEELASDLNMVGIIGPMLSEQVVEIAPVAEAYQMPILSPTASSTGLPDLNSYVFRNALTREMQGQYMARYAMNELKLRRFTVVYPLEAYGMDLKDAFVREVESLGGQVLAVVSYERGQTDFREQILKIGGVPDDDMQKMVNDQLLKNIEPPALGQSGVLSRPVLNMGHVTEDKIENLKVAMELSYDAIYLPGFYDMVGLIVPQLVFYNIDKVPLLGANGWNSPELVRLAGKHIRSGYFVDGFYEDSQKPPVKLFVQKFRKTFGESPNILSAQAYDTARMFIEIVLSGVTNRVGVRDRLYAIRDFPGVSGLTTILPSGESDKRLFTLKVEQKSIVEVN